MKNKLNFITKAFLARTFTVLMMIGMLNSLAFSQTRIRFKRGESSATVSGTIPSGSSRSYVLGARAGQMMTVEVSSGGDMWLDIGGNDVGEGITIECRSTDDYIITVHNNDDVSLRFSLYVEIN